MTEPPATPADEPVAFQVKRKEKFATIPTALVRDPTASPYVVATYVALDSRTDGKDTEVWPSWSLLAAESHQSMGRLSKSLQWLEERGWISVERRYDADGHRKVNKYTLYWSPNVLISPDEISPDSTSEVPDSTGLILSGREEEDPSESEPQKKNHSLATASQKPTNYPWQLLTSTDGPFKLSDTTKTQRSRVGRLAADMNATLDHHDIHGPDRGKALWSAVVAWPDHYPNMILTPNALEVHLAALLAPPLRATRTGTDPSKLYRDEDPEAFDAYVREGIANPKPMSEAQRKAKARR